MERRSDRRGCAAWSVDFTFAGEHSWLERRLCQGGQPPGRPSLPIEEGHVPGNSSIPNADSNPYTP
eukprot:scaffold117868_cov63-Phaeocystis_antarctica.AAC.1